MENQEIAPQTTLATPEPKEPKSNLSIPIAIVLAGALIAGAVYFRDSGLGLAPAVANPGNTVAQVSNPDITISPVSSDDHVLGSPNSPITFIEYSDFDCPYCRNFHPVVNKLVEEYGKTGKLALVYRHFPLSDLHPNAPKKAEASECAADQGGNDVFWKYADLLFKGLPAHGGDPTPELVAISDKLGLSKKDFESCLSTGRHSEHVTAQYKEAVTAGGRGTPYNILVLKKELTEKSKNSIAQVLAKYGPEVYSVSKDNMRLSLNGALPYDSIKQTIDIILAGK